MEIIEMLGSIDWTATGTIAATGIAIASFVISLRTIRENKKYKAPDFRFTPLDPIDSRSRLRLTNNGESSAKNVKLVFDFDPTGMFTNQPLEWVAIDKDEPVTIIFDSDFAASSAHFDTWLQRILSEHPERRTATIEYTTRLGKRNKQEVLIPAEAK